VVRNAGLFQDRYYRNGRFRLGAALRRTFHRLPRIRDRLKRIE
jgi:hypothetical protein